MLTQAGKVALLRSYAPGYKVFVETGIYNGHGSGHEMLDLFDAIWMLDLDIGNCMAARRPLLVHTAPGDSAVTLPRLLQHITGPALFWLDAHLVREYDGDEKMADNPCPLLAELRAILGWEHADKSTVLIDDVRLFGIEPGWPTMDEVTALGVQVWYDTLLDDVLAFTPE